MRNKKGSALILSILLITLVLFMAMYFLNFSLTEDKISHSQTWGAKTYYLAEAGIAEMVWKLKNDLSYKNNFETNPSWTANFVRNNPFGPDSGSYSVTVTNSALARAEIVSVGSIDVGDGSSQRIVKTFVYKALNVTEVDMASSTALTDNKMSISASQVNFVGGGLHSNADINVSLISTVNVDEDLGAVNRFTKSFVSTVNVGGEIHDNFSYPPQPANVPMPPISFDTAGDPDSLKAQADVIYTAAQFQSLMDSSPNPLVLNNDITYVTGDIVFEGDPDITLNGLLVSDGSITIGKVRWMFIIPYCQNGQYTALTVNHSSGKPSGLIAKNNINFELCTDPSDINGIIYAANKISVLDFADGLEINGAMVSRNTDIIGIWQPVNITLDNGIVNDTLGETEFSPVITVEHWEEEY